MAEYRLDRFLVLNGIGTRNQVKDMVKRGLVTKNGAKIYRPEEKVDPASDRLAVSGRPVCFSEKVYYMMNKPAGVITAVSDGKHKTVMDLLPDKRTDLFPVGRLDIDAEGLLLITNDGELGHRLLSPRRHVDKVYFVRTAGKIPAEAVGWFAAGMDLGDFTAMPAVLEVLDGTSARVTVREGKFHQVKRMFEAAGTRVTYLQRLSMGTLRLDEKLKPGESRLLTAEEEASLTGTDCTAYQSDQEERHENTGSYL